MAINIKNFLNVKNKLSKMRDFQDLGHLDGISISAITADLYGDGRDDITLFYFSEGAKYASVYTKSKIVSENIKFNLQLKNKLVKALFINTKNANTFTGKQGFESIKELAKYLSKADMVCFSSMTPFADLTKKIDAPFLLTLLNFG